LTHPGVEESVEEDHDPDHLVQMSCRSAEAGARDRFGVNVNDPGGQTTANQPRFFSANAPPPPGLH